MMKKLQRLLALAALVALPMAAGAQTGTALTNSDMPRTFTFEAGSGDDAYLNYANGSDGWYIGGATYNNGSQSLYISNDNGTTNAYSSNNIYSYAWVTLDIQESGEYEFAFDWKCYGESSYDYMYVYLAPASVTPTANQSLSGATQIGSRFNQQSSWQHFYGTQVITDDQLGEYKLIFMWRSDVSGIYSDPAAIDDLYVGKLTCPAPTSLSFSDYSNNGATASWTPVGEETSWIVYLNGVPVDDNPVTETSYTFSGLDANTNYNVWVRAYCAEGDTSMQLSGSFRTLCQEGNCQVQVSGASSLYGYAEVYQNGDMLASVTSSADVEICNGDSLIVLYHAGSYTWSTVTINVTDVAGTQLASFGSGGHSTGDTILAVANGCPSCMPVQSVHYISTSSYSATVHWTDNGGATPAEYVIYVNGSVDYVSNDTSYTFPTVPLTDYTVTVARMCDDDDISAVRTVSFTSPCDDDTYAPLPFHSGFEDLDPTADHLTNLLPDCWVQVQTGTNTGLNPNPVFPMAYRHTPNAHNSDVYFEFESNQGETEVLALPRMENVSNLQLSFYASATNTSNFTLEAGVVELDDLGNYVFVPVDTINLIQGSTFQTGYHVYNVLFDTYEGPAERLAIRATPNPPTSTSTYTLMIDDFSVIYAGSPVLGPFTPATHTVNVDTNLVLAANLMSGEGVNYTWESQMVSAGNASIVSQDSNTVTINYTAGGIDSVSVIASTGFGDDDTATVIIYVVDNEPIAEFPYNTSFEDGEDISYRTANNANGWYVGTATAATGTHSLYISSTHGETNVYSNQASANSYATRQFRFTDAGEYQLGFSWKNNGGSSSYMRTYLVQGDYQPSAGSYPSGTSLTNDLYGASDWQTIETVMDVDTGLYTLVFYWYNGYLASSNNPPAAVDDLSIEKLNCSRIGNLTASSVYAHGATISWTPRSEESEWWVVVDDGDGYAVSDTTLQLSGFDGQTQHTVSVRAICGAGDTSAARTVSFTTTIACPAVSNIHATDVTGSSATIEWTAGGIETAWKLVINGGDTIDVSDEPSYSATGLEALTQYTVTIIADCGDEDGVSTSATGTFITLCDAGTCDVTVDMVDNASDGWNGNSLSFVQNGAPIGSASLASGSTGTATISVCTAYPLSVIFNAGSWTSEVGATIYSGSGAELYSFAAGSMSSSNNGDTLFTATAPCSGCPMPSALQVTNIEETSITISWTDNDTVQGFVVSVDGGDWQAATGNTFTATGLSASSNHNFAVRTLCGADDTSNARTIDVRTLCGSVDVPWTEGFETISSNIDCWTSIHGSSSGIELNTTSSRVHSGSKSLRFNGYAQTPNIAVLPSFSQAISGLEIDMWVLAESSASSGTLRIGYMTDLTDSSTFVSVVDLPAGSYTNYTEVLVNFASAPDSAFIAIAQKNENQNYWWWIDDLSVDVIGTHPDPGTNPGTECETPTISSVTATESSVELTFSGSAESYEVAIVEGDWSAPATTTTITATTHTFTGLEAGTQYNVGVRAVCDDGVTSTWVHQSITTEDVELPCTCNVPTNLHQVSVESTSAVIDWTPGENNESWDISVNGSTVNVTTHPATITGLTAGSSNTVRIRAHCCDGETSAWTPDITVTTSGSGEGIDNVSALHIGLTPNPASDVVVLSGAAEGAQVSVVDMNGRTVRTLTANGENVNIDLGGLAAGAYFVRVSDSQNLAIRKLIVK